MEVSNFWSKTGRSYRIHLKTCFSQILCKLQILQVFKVKQIVAHGFFLCNASSGTKRKIARQETDLKKKSSKNNLQQGIFPKEIKKSLCEYYCNGIIAFTHGTINTKHTSIDNLHKDKYIYILIS
jgi:hypothetical protein